MGPGRSPSGKRRDPPPFTPIPLGSERAWVVTLREFRVGTPLPGGQPKNPAGGSVCAAGMRKRVSLDKTSRGAHGKTMASTAALDQSSAVASSSQRRVLRHPAGLLSYLDTGRSELHPPKRKAPPRDGALPIYFNRDYLLAEAIDQAALDAQVILFCAAKVGVQILELDRAEGQVRGNREVRAAAERHRKRIR